MTTIPDPDNTVLEVPEGVHPLDALRAAEGIRPLPDSTSTPDPGGEEPPAQPADPDGSWLRPGQFRSGEDVLRSYDELRSDTDRVRQENAALRARLESIDNTTGYQQPNPQPQAAPGTPGVAYSQDQLQVMMFEEPARYHAYMLEQATQAAEQRVLEKMAPVLAPMIDSQNRNDQTLAIQQMTELLGPEGPSLVQKHGQAVASYIDQNPAYFEDPATRGLHLAQHVALLEFHDRMRSGQLPPRAANGQFTTGAEQAAHHTAGASAHNPSAEPAPQQELDPEKAKFLRDDPGDIYGPFRG